MPAERRAMGLLDAAQYLGKVQEKFCEEYGIRLHGTLPDREGSEGICHSIMTERYVLPGQIAIGTDSHTTHCGALGSLAFGVGATDMANAWVTGDVRISVPKTCRIVLEGALKPGVDAKDIVLHLLQLPKIRNGGAVGQVIEYSGPVVQSLGTDARATLTNMVAEIGGMTGIVVPDEETVRFLRERRNVNFVLESWMSSDEGAVYDDCLVVDCSAISSMAARPGDPGRGIPLNNLHEQIRIDIAYGGSCTGGKREDFIAYHGVLKWGMDRGMKIPNGVEFFLQFGSQDVREYCAKENMLSLFEQAGVHLIEPGCGACINAGPGTSQHGDQVTVSAINRNFPGRSGPGDVWLASPATVAASALAGKIVSFAQLQSDYAQVAG
jgi:3-isopropylmalate/(R)-2-methylmalate dehydratase large subunit